MNKSDSERIAGLLTSLGGAEANGQDMADLVIFNTCSVRQSAENRVFGQLHNLGDAGCPHGVSLAQQPAGGVHRDPAAKPGRTGVDERPAFTLLAEPE